MRKHPQIVIGVLLIALFICIAITAPLLAPNDPNATNLALKNAPPSAEYPLGCDQMGRCELSRLIYGARYSLSLTVPVLIVLAAIALFIGCYRDLPTVRLVGYRRLSLPSEYRLCP